MRSSSFLKHKIQLEKRKKREKISERKNPEETFVIYQLGRYKQKRFDERNSVKLSLSKCLFNQDDYLYCFVGHQIDLFSIKAFDKVKVKQRENENDFVFFVKKNC